jgi:glycosyltransferase involved in cell wall biosynthesis
MTDSASITGEIGTLRVQLVGPVPPPYGGMALQAVLLQRLLRQDGMIADLLGHNEALCESLRFVERVPGLRTGIRAVRFYFRFWSRLREKDIVHILAASWVNFLLVVAPAVWMARLRGKRVILNYRAGDADHFLRWLGWFVQMFFRPANVVSAPSTFLADVIHKRLGVPVSIVPNIVNLSLFRFRERRLFQPKMLVTRHLEAIYDVECVLRAFQIVQETYPEASLWIAGTGSEGRRLQALTERWNLTGVRFLGHVAHAALAGLYDQCDILLNGSRVDNFPGSLIEASAAGLAVVSTKAGGIPAMYESGKNALLVEVGDWKALASEVVRLLQDQELARSLAAAGVELSRQCEWKNVRRALYAVYGVHHMDGGQPGLVSPRGDFIRTAGADGLILEKENI